MHVYEVRPRKDKSGADLVSDVLPFGRAVFATAFCVLILCIVCPASVHAAKAPEKSDAELTKALIGTWELVPSPGPARKTFLEFNADGTSKAIGITTQRRAPRRVEAET